MGTMAGKEGEPVLKDVSPADDFDVGENARSSDEEDANPASVHQVRTLAWSYSLLTLTNTPYGADEGAMFLF